MILPVHVNQSIRAFSVRERGIDTKFSRQDRIDVVFYEEEGSIRLFPQFGVYGEPKMFDNIDSFDVHGVINEIK